MRHLVKLIFLFFVTNSATNSNDFLSSKYEYCADTQRTPKHPNGSAVQELSVSLDIDTISFESSIIFRIDYTIKSKWTVNQDYCLYYLGFLKHHGYFSERDEKKDHEDVILVIPEDVYSKFIWIPDNTCLSAREEDEPSSTDSKLSFMTLQSDDDDIRWPKKIVCKMELQRKLFALAVCPMNLKTYPVDIQPCPIKFGSFTMADGNVIYKWNESSTESKESIIPITVHDESALNAYSIQKIVTGSSVKIVMGESFTIISFEIFLKRFLLSTFIGMYIPSGLIVALSWLSFFLSPSSPPARANLLVTALLALLTQFTASRADITTSEVTSLDIWFLVCFAYVFAALVQFSIIKAITTRSDDESKLKDEDNEFQERHHVKEKAGEIALTWQSRTQKNNHHLEISSVRKRSRLESIPFANVPAATRLRSYSDQNIYSRTNERLVTGDEVSEFRSSQQQQIRGVLPDYSVYKIGTNSESGYLPENFYTFTEDERSLSSGLGSVSVDGSAFNSPPSSHFYYSPDIFMQKPWLIDQSIDIPGHIYNLPNMKSEISVASKYAQPIRYPTFDNIVSSCRSKSGSKLSYLSPLAPDYIQRNLSMISKSTDLYSSVYSLGPSSFHSSQCYSDHGTNPGSSHSNSNRSIMQSKSQSYADYSISKSRCSNQDVDQERESTALTVDGHYNDGQGIPASKLVSLGAGQQFSRPPIRDQKLLDSKHKSNLVFNQTKTINKSKADVPGKKIMMKVEDLMKKKLLVSKIEKFSRILFPLTFILFNFFYWPYIYSRS